MDEQGALSRLRQPSVMVVDDDYHVRTVVSAHLRRSGFVVVEADGAEEAIESYDSVKPAVVLTDVVMPNTTGLELLKTLKSKDRNAVVILMSGHGTEAVLLDALSGGATGFFAKPFDHQELASFIRTVIRQSREPSVQHLLTKHIISERKQFEMGIEQSSIAPIVDQITLNLAHLVPESDLVNLRVGIHEMIDNAIEHGNLAISFEEKSTSIVEGTFSDLLLRRMNDDANKGKKIRIRSNLEPGTFQVEIEDEGDGFDWRSLPDPVAEALLSFNGRGVLLTKIYFDEVAYNEKGNVVTLTKRIADWTSIKDV